MPFGAGSRGGANEDVKTAGGGCKKKMGRKPWSKTGVKGCGVGKRLRGGFRRYPLTRNDEEVL